MPRAAHLLTRQHRPTRAELAAFGPLTLVPARAHEFCGAARRVLALSVARATAGPVYWIRPFWGADRLHPPEVARWIDPGRLVFLDAKRSEDLLWATEEVLRAGIVALTVVDLPGPPALTPVRRLHLAAESGAETGAETGPPPLGLILTPGRGGAPGVESRWSLVPRHGPDGRTAWRLDRLRARTAPPAAWDVAPDPAGGLAVIAASPPAA